MSALNGRGAHNTMSRKVQGNNCAAAENAFDFKRAAMHLHHGGDQGEPESGTPGLSRQGTV